MTKDDIKKALEFDCSKDKCKTCKHKMRITVKYL